MKRLKQLVLSGLVLAGLGLALTPTPALAINVWGECAGNNNVVCNSASKDSAALMTETIIKMILYLVGIVAVVMIVIGGFRYVASQGDASAIKGAKDTIMYAVIGLVVAVLAYTIVNFVTSRL